MNLRYKKTLEGAQREANSLNAWGRKHPRSKAYWESLYGPGKWIGFLADKPHGTFIACYAWQPEGVKAQAQG